MRLNLRRQGLGLGISAARRSGGAEPVPAITIASLMDSTSFWWDGSDAATITKNGSDQVSQIADKSGNANHLTQSTDLDKPLANVSMNGVDCIDCRPDLFMLPTANPFLFGPCEVFTVFWSDRATAATNAFVLTMPGGSTTNTTVGSAKTQFGGSALAKDSLANDTLRHSLIQHAYIEATGSTTQYLQLPTQLRSGATNRTAVGGTRAAFATSGGAAPMNGLFCEMVVFNKTLTANERAAVISELRTKWQALTAVTKYHVVLLAGQSNMRGAYGPVSLTTDATDPRIAMLGRTYTSAGVVIEDDAGEIMLAENPLTNRWRDTATPPPEDTVGPGLSYAKALLATLPSNEGVLLVPCAQGSTYVMPLTPTSPDVTWHPEPQSGRSNAPLLDAVARTNRMLALGHEMHSILWCQGESDAAQATMSQATYSANFDAVLAYLRSNITGASATPFISVQIGSFLSGGTYPNAGNVNASIADLPNRDANSAFVSNTGYTSGGDNLHYDAASARAIGDACWTAFGTI